MEGKVGIKILRIKKSPYSPSVKPEKVSRYKEL
jgi:hypothetical protein